MHENSCSRYLSWILFPVISLFWLTSWWGNHVRVAGTLNMKSSGQALHGGARFGRSARYIALQVMHAPQEVPESFSKMYPSPKYDNDYAIMNGMATAADQVLGNTTSALEMKGLWANTLFIYTSDNGGPAGQLSSGHSGNNWPLRGGKTNNFEGGIRVNAFVAGGFVPKSVGGQTRDGYIHGCDWYPTVCALAGIDAHSDIPAGIPGIDGMDMWGYITGNVSKSPRTEIMISSEDTGAIISGDMKLIIGLQTYGFWQGPEYPNATTDHSKEKEFDCGVTGCLFNITADPSEYTDLAATHPSVLKQMHELFAQRNATAYETPKLAEDPEKCAAYVKANQGFLGPYMDTQSEL
eukprot:m.603621 g.603621  ORF g.603621 m.603621 type:complete len:351 (-) comp22455_c2_seq8:2081-3133(-)